MTVQPLVSIIMPAYNNEKFITESIDSVVLQTYKNWELIVVDDCSFDNTPNIIRQFAINNRRIIPIVLETNRGAAFARNAAIKKAKGEFIAFLDSDDYWYKDKLLKQIDFMISNQFDFTATYYNHIDEQSQSLNKTVIVKAKLDYDGIVKYCPGNSTIVYNASVLGKFYIPDIRKRNDYLMWLQVIKKAGILYGYPEVLASYRIREGSLSKNKFDLVKYHYLVYRKHEKMSIFRTVYFIIFKIIQKLTD